MNLSPPVNISLTVPRRFFSFGSFLLFMFNVGVCCVVVLLCLFLAALWSPAGKGMTSWLLCMLCFHVFCHFPKCVLVRIRNMGEVGAVKLA